MQKLTSCSPILRWHEDDGGDDPFLEQLGRMLAFHNTPTAEQVLSALDSLLGQVRRSSEEREALRTRVEFLQADQISAALQIERLERALNHAALCMPRIYEPSRPPKTMSRQAISRSVKRALKEMSTKPNHTGKT